MPFVYIFCSDIPVVHVYTIEQKYQLLVFDLYMIEIPKLRRESWSSFQVGTGASRYDDIDAYVVHMMLLYYN